MIADRDTLAPAGRVLGPLLAAAAFELLAWGLALGSSALEPGWYGRTSLLRAVHLVTLGVLALSLVGAGWQLVPVISARPWRAPLAPWVNGGLLAGLALLILGFGRPDPWLGHLGAGLAVGALLLRSALVLGPLVRASGRLASRLWLIGAEVALWAGLARAVVLWLRLVGHLQMTDVIDGVRLHATLLLAGWVAGWIVGTGSVLLPMFAVSREPPQRWMGAMVVIWALGLGFDVPLLWAAGLLGGLGGLALTLVRGARSGPSLIQAGLGLVGVGLAALLAAWGRAPADVVVSLALALGVLPLLRGVAQRIVPFLAWTHAFGASLRAAPPVASLTPGRVSSVQAVLSLAGGVALVAGRLVEQGPLARLGALLLAAGALLHLAFLARASFLAALGHNRGQALAGTERT